jgi:hypothetical protein
VADCRLQFMGIFNPYIDKASDGSDRLDREDETHEGSLPLSNEIDARQANMTRCCILSVEEER